MPLDYETLRIIWWVLLGALLIGFAIMDGFDLGVGIILHRVARTNDERRTVINTIGPIWEGNQIWFILGGGAIFAAWPEIYAVSFSGFYYAMLLVLFALILRPVGFKYRGKIACDTWRAAWDIGLFIGGFVPTLVFGVAIGNVLQGVPFQYDSNLQSYYHGTFIGLFSPFSILCGLVSVTMCVMHGGLFLSLKNTGEIQARAQKIACAGAMLTVILFAIGGFYLMYLKGYTLAKPVPFDGPSNPLHKKVLLETGAWLNNYKTYHWMMIAPILGLVFPILAIITVSLRYYGLAWIMSALSIAGIIASCGFSMFPFILPSSTNPDMSLLLWDASSSQLTLFIMLFATVIFLPLIILYTSWVYYVLRGKVTSEAVLQNKSSY